MSVLILCPWNISSKHKSQPIVDEFLKKISFFEEIQIKNLENAKQNVDDFYLKELNKVQKNRPLLVLADPCGKSYTSEEFAKTFENIFVQASRVRDIWICLGDAHGLPSLFSQQEIAATLSLSTFTLSHEIALLVILEQLYRCFMIQKNHPYHHGVPSPFASQNMRTKK